MGARKKETVEENFVEAWPPRSAGRRGGVALLVFSKDFDKTILRNAADFSFKEGSRIFKQRAPNWTLRFLEAKAIVCSPRLLARRAFLSAHFQKFNILFGAP